MTIKWSWKEGFSFAFAKDLQREGSSYTYKKNRVEKFGSTLLQPIYMLAAWISQRMQKRHIIILTTLAAIVVTAVIFYDIPAVFFLGKVFPPKVFRLLFYIYFEISFLAAGCKAFGRFNNKTLVAEWKSGKLIAVFPGDKIGR